MTQQLALTSQDNLMPSPDEWRTMSQMAEVLVKSGFLPESIRTPQAALAIMLKGKELGIPPMQAFSSINVIKGKPTLAAELMAALVLRAGHALRVTETNSERCTIEIQRKGETFIYKHTFTIKEAEAAGLLSNQTWQKYRPALLRARCISAGCRVACPDVIMGMHTAEEMGAMVEMTDEGQEVIIAETSRPQPVISIVPAATETVPEEDIPALDDTENSILLDYTALMADADTQESLEQIGAKIGTMDVTQALRTELKATYTHAYNRLLKAGKWQSKKA